MPKLARTSNERLNPVPFARRLSSLKIHIVNECVLRGMPSFDKVFPPSRQTMIKCNEPELCARVSRAGINPRAWIETCPPPKGECDLKLFSTAEWDFYLSAQQCQGFAPMGPGGFHIALLLIQFQ